MTPKPAPRRPQRRTRRTATPARRRTARRGATPAAPAVPAPAVERAPAPIDLAAPEGGPLPDAAATGQDGAVAALPPDLPMARPEGDYVARKAPPPSERPMPAGRRAIFFDVENSSHAPYIERMIQQLAIDRADSRTDFVAVGNWRVIGLDTARLLARRGAQLIHSAPATGVRDWSDLRIAVSAGVWLASARPGDVVEIVSDDRAFDAVGDVAATLGITFHRLSYRTLSGAPETEPRAEAPPARGGRRGRRSRRRGPGSAPAPHAERSGERRHAPPPHRPAPPPPPAEPAEPHTAPHDEIVQVVQDLAGRTGGRPVLIDTLARELKARGFSRPPGSPRLITRLRRIKELSVSPTGMITLIGPGHAPRPSAGPAAAAPAEPATEADRPRDAGDDAGDGDEESTPAAAAAPAGRSTRRGSRRRRRGGRGRARATA